MLIYCVFVCIMYYPAAESFFPRNLKLSNSYRTFGCHNYVSSQSRQCFLRKNFLSSSAASLVHQSSLHELMVTKRVYYKCKSRSPKGPKPLSERNEPKLRVDRKSPAPVLHSCENLLYFTQTC